MSNSVHFLNTDNSYCTIIESNGHFAMIDAAEDTEYPLKKPQLKLKGYEKEVYDCPLFPSIDRKIKIC